MSHIDLTQTAEPVRAFQKALRDEPKGTFIAYHEGPCLHNVTRKPVGKAVQEAYEKKRCIPVQRRVSDGVYRYFAVVM